MENIVVKMEQLFSAAVEENDRHNNECKQCADFRRDGTGDDLCFDGRKRQQLVYLLDETNEQLVKTVHATSYEQMFGTFLETK